jgi:hypothetical protein
MALEIETGAGIADAESYGTYAEFKAWATANGYVIPAQAVAEVLLRKGMIPLQRGDEWKGCKYSKAQGQDFPRTGVVIDGYSYDADETPALLKKAQFMYANAAQTIALDGITNTNASGAVIEKTVGPITTKYAEPSRTNVTPRIEAAEKLLKPLMRAVGNSIPLSRS